MRRITLLLLVAAAFHPVTAAQPAVSGVLTAAWSLPGRWSGVATDEKTGVICALGDDRFAEIDVQGRIRHESRFPWNSEARLLRLATSPRVAVVTFTPWGIRRGVVGHGVRGERLWNYVVPDGPGDVWVSDVDGDKIDEVIIGYNGRGGVHVLDDQGRLRWTASLANVWMVAAGDVLGLGTSQVVTTSARGRIHIFNVIDAVRGQVIGLVSGQGHVEVGWAVDPPLLLVATGEALNAFRVGVD